MYQDRDEGPAAPVGDDPAESGATLTGLFDRQLTRRPVASDDRQPETHLERTLAAIWEEVLGQPAAGISADFLESGGDSLNFLSLVAAIETRLDLSLPLDELFDNILDEGVTIATLATAVMLATRSNDANLFLTVWQSFGPQAPLFFFPGIGGDAVQMRLFARAMGRERPLLIFHRRPADRSGEGIEQLAARCIALMRERQPEGPHFVGGTRCGARWRPCRPT